MTSLFAFLHHIAAFALVAALTVEFVLLRGELTVQRARQLQLTDLILGVSAGVVLVVGLVRVFYFEKGASYYFHSVPFVAKVSLFVIVALLSIYPTVEFLSWGKNVRQGRAPVMAEGKLRSVRAVIDGELIAIALLVLCAVLMARGIGHLG